ncbi:uncharacterized protein BT62DRAFT_129900 [Guyanagaster necrorhizus]|uniref:Uncharacterized protein n=1 Tax=Guyanagaster necrorhizus TaxID=856835 RepID=A0A9P7VVG3_9AGAR|nr:uncharacterized protein BT62DRAFT_129900 [Guyanagaster necrorhizus MCA 3950]KAG7446621.1 hypothetical protein BT62DRAFT_129900 [Guyanagaster necrorhizus MCA 3950]
MVMDLIHRHLHRSCSGYFLRSRPWRFFLLSVGRMAPTSGLRTKRPSPMHPPPPETLLFSIVTASFLYHLAAFPRTLLLRSRNNGRWLSGSRSQLFLNRLVISILFYLMSI